MKEYKFLIDTNIVIGLEDHHKVSSTLSVLSQKCSKFHIRIFVNQANIDDIERDKDSQRKEITLSKLKKFERIEGIAFPNRDELSKKYGVINSDNDVSDIQLLHCLNLNVVDFLITHDKKLQRRASKVNLGHRVLRGEEALDWISQAFEPKAIDLPFIFEREAHSIEMNNSIFDSLRSDYQGFDDWFTKCISEHRKCWVVEVNETIAGIVIRNEEDAKSANIETIGNKILKLCTFKMAPNFRGEKFGEHLLKQALWFAQKNQYDVVYLTAYEKQVVLIHLLENFGFVKTKKKKDGEFFFEKKLKYGMVTIKDTTNFLKLARQIYPRFYDGSKVSKFIVPIKPDYHQKLFPEIAFPQKLPLFSDEGLIPLVMRQDNGEERTPGNSIRKVYLCRAAINQIKAGDLLLFYHSKGEGLSNSQCLTTLCIVESVILCETIDELVHLTAKRSVFSQDELKGFQEKSKTPVKVINFLLMGHLAKKVSLKELISLNVFKKSPPQSIKKIKEDDFLKLKRMIKMDYHG